MMYALAALAGMCFGCGITVVVARYSWRIEIARVLALHDKIVDAHDKQWYRVGFKAGWGARDRIAVGPGEVVEATIQTRTGVH